MYEQHGLYTCRSRIQQSIRIKKRHAPPVTVGVEDTFSYMISDECVGCEACVANCPVHAIAEQSGAAD
ncbi:4Fe-4S binding protein [Enterocloster clostridioformis]|uniref:4Fe-4S binding protein n=1 Tax=Enterocloster clostridioformis TaxID=1531 RepID=UPI003A7F1DAC